MTDAQKSEMRQRYIDAFANGEIGWVECMNLQLVLDGCEYGLTDEQKIETAQINRLQFSSAVEHNR